MCEVCNVDKICATCAFSTFERENTQLCGQQNCCVHEDYFCPGWQPLIIQFGPKEPPRVFGRLDETPSH